MVKNILLLTATVKPQSEQPDLKMLDFRVRESEYSAALAFYCGNRRLRSLFDSIVLCENSDYDLNRLVYGVSDRSVCANLWAFPPEPALTGVHRGYSEFRMIDAACTNIKDIYSSQLEEVRIWKVTGRYIVRNLATIVEMADDRYDWLVYRRGGWVETSIFRMKLTAGLKALPTLLPRLRQASPPELAFGKLLYEGSKGQCGKGPVGDFLWPPLIYGRRGTDGTKFGGRFPLVKHGLAVGSRIILGRASAFMPF